MTPAGGIAQAIDEAFSAAVSRLPGAQPLSDLDASVRLGSRLEAGRALEIFDSQMKSRHLDLAARWLRSRDQGFYTIGSAGHEGNAAVAAALRVTDPAFLHYRSGAFYVERARQLPEQQPLRDVLFGVVAARDEPIAGGRHKVFGSVALNIPPQTSTIASHLPKAFGAAFAHERAAHLGVSSATPDDAIVMCSFGDASANHSTATGAINAACRAGIRLPAPILFVCEDNGLGISVPTPPGWIAEVYGSRPGLRYFEADGCDLCATYEAAVAAADWVRAERRPAFLHLRMVRLMGHAGSDVEITYRSSAELRADQRRDPLLVSARLLVGAGAIAADEVLARYEAVRAEVRAVAEQAEAQPRLDSAEEIAAPLAQRSPDAVAAEVARPVEARARDDFWDGRLPEGDEPCPLATHINRALGDLLVKYPEMLLFGEDVGRKGGVYGVTRGLDRRAGMGRVFDTILDEQTVLGLAIGAAHVGFLPIPEIQYLAYLHNAEDQIRGEAATLQFFSCGQYRNPMVVRIAAYGYQKGFGGHFHNDNSIAVLRDIPGLIIASPSAGDDAAAMLRTCVAAAQVDGAVCVYLEPIAMYPMRDLYEADDGLLALSYDPRGQHVPVGAARTWGQGSDLVIVSFANGVRMSRRVARRLEADHGIRARVLDLRWLAPLPREDLLREAAATGRVLVADETRATGGVSEGVIAALVDMEFEGKIRRVASRDCLIPLGDAAELVLLSEEEIEAAAIDLCG